MWDQVLREEQHGRVGVENRRLNGLVCGVFRRKVGVALPCVPIVCVYRFPSCRELWRRVTKLEDESAECQADRAQSWHEADEA